MTAVVIVLVLLAVLGFGMLVFWLMRGSRQEVPELTDARAAQGPRVVAVDEHGDAVTDADEPDAPPRDQTAFEDILQDEIRDRGMEQPRAGDDAG
jgi:hypothetical protein